MSEYTFNESTVRVPFARVKEWSAKVYEKMGMSKEDALITADIQAVADLRGMYSHGIQRCDAYVWRIQNHTIDPKAKPSIEKDAGALVLIDGKNAMGQVSAYYGMQIAIERAKKYGSSTVMVQAGNHFGTCAYFSQMASEQGMIALCVAQGAGNNIAPTGAKEALLGNSPMGWAIPAGDKPDVVLDMALTTVAGGRVTMAALMNQTIPDNWALDKDGIPTTDPKKFAMLQPMGGYKGYGLSFIDTLMTAVVCDTPWGREQHDLLQRDHKYANEPLNITYMMQVIDVSAITDADAYRKRVDDAIDLMKSAEKATGTKEILVPGEPEAQKLAEQMKNGIEYPLELIEQVNKLSDDIGVEHLV